VAGEPYPGWRDLDFPRHPVALTINDSRTLTGSGAAVLGDPLGVVAWLANELPKFGRRLSRGDRITTGVTTDIYLAVPGDRLTADFDPLGRVSMSFDRG
jgi:2-keto-4-pentenoate hydratase